MTAPEWRECADPDELAAAVAAGVEVRAMGRAGDFPTANQTADRFAGSLRAGITYRIPTDWSPEPPADDEPCATNPCEACRGRAVRATDECTLSPDRVGSPAGNDHPVTIPPADDLRERRVWNCKIGGRVGVLPGGADAPMRRAVADAFTAETGYPVEFCFSGWGDDLDESELAVVENREPDPEVIRAALVKRLTALPGGSTVDTAPPVPPWPGAVLSGLTEADAERTKLRHKLVESAPPVPPSGDENDNIARLTEDQGDRIVNACCRMLSCEPADIDGDAAYEEILTEAVERCADLHGQDRWEDDCHGCGFRVGDHTTDGRCPPVPPWPGAVLSGLCDEDGVPTWLALAPNVLGEAVRTCIDFPWFVCGSDNAVTPYWVEVRAPRAVPEPETERVPWWKAKDRNGLAGDPFVEVGSDDEGPWVRVVEGGTKLHSPVAPDGTVEVLKDGDQ